MDFAEAAAGTPNPPAKYSAWRMCMADGAVGEAASRHGFRIVCALDRTSAREFAQAVLRSGARFSVVTMETCAT